jgi:hypothetical protein
MAGDRGLETRIPARLSTAEGRKFGLTVGLAFVALSLLLWWRDHATARAITGVAGALFIAGGLLLPARMGPVYRTWMQIGLAISKVTTPIFLFIVFFLVITPFGLIARAFGHRPLAPKAADSLWRERAEGDRTSNLQRQF